jgi:hypothetical protein
MTGRDIGTGDFVSRANARRNALAPGSTRSRDALAVVDEDLTNPALIGL